MFNISIKLQLILIVFFAIFLRLYHIDTQGFTDSDEFASRFFINDYWKFHDLKGIGGSFWGRPTSFVLDIFLYNLFGIDPLIYLIRASIFGILLILIIYYLSKNYFDQHTAIFSSAIVASLFTFIYYSRSMKYISLSFFFVALCIFIFFYLTKKKTNIVNKKYHIFFGILCSLSITSHPNTIPIITCLIFLYFLRFIFFDKKKIIRIIKIFLISFSSIIIFYELCFILLRILPSFNTRDISSFIQSVLFLPKEIMGAKPTINFYFNFLFLQDKWFLYLSIFSTIFGIYSVAFKKSFEAFCLLFLAYMPMVIYIFFDIPGVLRNIYSSLIPVVILDAWFLSFLIRQIKNKYLFNSLSIIITVSILLTSINHFPKISDGLGSLEKLYKINNGSEYSAFYVDKNKPLYHVTEYYFTSRDLYVSNWNEVWKKYFCNSVDNIILYSKEENNEIYEFKYDKYKNIKMLNSDGTFYNAKYTKLDNILDYFNNKLFTHSSTNEILEIPVNNFDEFKKKNDIKKFLDIKKIKINFNEGENFFTIKSNFTELNDDQFLIFGLGTAKNPFLYDVKIIENNKFAINKKKYRYKYFKHGWNINYLNKDDLYFTIFANKNSSNITFKNMYLHTFSTLKKYNNFHNCNNLKSQRDFSNDLIILNDLNSSLKNIKFKSGKNTLPANNLKPNQEYKLSFKARYGLLSLGRVSIVLKPNYMVDETFFLPFPSLFYKSHEIRFTTPSSLRSNDMIDFNFITQYGLPTKFKDIVLEELNS
jgi:hypothetical protein